MNLLYLGIILALIPVLNMILRYRFSKRSGEFHLFRKHPTTFYLDWLFVPANLLCVYAIDISWMFMGIILAFGALTFFLLNRAWIKQHKQENNPVYLFDIKTGKMKPSGFVEAAFFIIEFTLGFSMFFSTIKNMFVYLELAMGFAFLIASFFSALKIHNSKKLCAADKYFFILITALLVIKLILTLS